MNNINYFPLFSKYIAKKKILQHDYLVLLDVGASGGISSQWDVFKPYLKATGFDPLISEINRLNSNNTDPQVQYLDYFVVSENPEIDNYRPSFGYNGVGRSSAFLHHQQQNIHYEKQVFNSNQPIVFTKNKISLDRFCSEQQLHRIDFIKTDTDGHDYQALCGAKRILGDEQTLGLFVECEHDAEFHPYANAFRNIDSLLVGSGFTLFDLPVTRYTRKDLPGKFFYSIPAQTHCGSVFSGDALYLRDFAKMKKQGKSIQTISLIKMACLQEIFGLPDCAAELLNDFQEQLAPIIDVPHCLDLLTQDMGLYATYQEHMSQFLHNPRAFFPSNLQQAMATTNLFQKIGRKIANFTKTKLRKIIG